MVITDFANIRPTDNSIPRLCAMLELCFEVRFDGLPPWSDSANSNTKTYWATTMVPMDKILVRAKVSEYPTQGEWNRLILALDRLSKKANGGKNRRLS